MNQPDLYDEAILRENRDPYHYEQRPSADLIMEAYNPLCGDQFMLYIYLSDGQISEVYFHGYGCAVSKASTSVLVRELTGMRLPEAKAHCRRFLTWLPSEEEAGDAVPAAWRSFAAARRFPDRLGCATLSWEAVVQRTE